MTGPKGPNPLSGERRATFARLADVLIPRLGTMPAASEVGAADYWLDRVLESRPDLIGALTRVLDHAQNADPEAAVLRLERDDAEGFATLLTAVAGGYYMSGEVRKRLGYAGQQAIELRTRPGEQLEGLVEPVVERGPIYRHGQ